MGKPGVPWRVLSRERRRKCTGEVAGEQVSRLWQQSVKRRWWLRLASNGRGGEKHLNFRGIFKNWNQ